MCIICPLLEFYLYFYNLLHLILRQLSSLCPAKFGLVSELNSPVMIGWLSTSKKLGRILEENEGARVLIEHQLMPKSDTVSFSLMNGPASHESVVLLICSGVIHDSCYSSFENRSVRKGLRSLKKSKHSRIGMHWRHAPHWFSHSLSKLMSSKHMRVL